VANLLQDLGLFDVPTDRPFLERLDGERLTYGGLMAATARFANALGELGVRPGDRVALQVDKSPEALVLYLACVRAGAVIVPLNTAYTLAELEYFLADAEPALVLVAPEKRDAVQALAPNAKVESLGADGKAGSLLQVAARQPATFDDVAAVPDDLCAILYTSGTTGRSKGAMLTHANLASNALTLRDAWRFTGADVLLHALPVYHTHGLFVATNIVLAAGASMIFLPAFDPKEVLRSLPQATVFMGVPTYYTRLLAEPGLDREPAASIRLFVSGSAPLPAETHREWRARTGAEILERYGMTETNMITSNPYDGPRVPGAVGPPLADVSVRITDSVSGAELLEGEIGMIEVKGPNVFKGYWRKPEKTAEEFRPDGYFITGDLGRIDEHGCVWIVGRGKDLIITGGLNVYPKEVEAEIDTIEGVEESAVIGLPHPDFGEAVTAVAVPSPGAVLDEQTIIADLRARLAGFKLPKRVLIEPSLPRNAMGKVQKAALRQRLASLYET
jgi:malonyl-CoA/methylmalonyl-CoA synthetase